MKRVPAVLVTLIALVALTACRTSSSPNPITGRIALRTLPSPCALLTGELVASVVSQPQQIRNDQVDCGWQDSAVRIDIIYGSVTTADGHKLRVSQQVTDLAHSVSKIANLRPAYRSLNIGADARGATIGASALIGWTPDGNHTLMLLAEPTNGGPMATVGAALYPKLVTLGERIESALASLPPIQKPPTQVPLSDGPQIAVYLCNTLSRGPNCSHADATPAQSSAILHVLKLRPETASVIYQSKAVEYAIFQYLYVTGQPEQAAYSAVSVADMEPSYWVILKDSRRYAGLEAAVKGMPGVDSVRRFRCTYFHVGYTPSVLDSRNKRTTTCL